MASVYSVRFLATKIANGSAYFTVPPGKRAVLRTITVSSYAGTGARATVTLAEHIVWASDLQGFQSRVEGQLRHVAYAGERIGVNHTVTDMTTVLSGYLFDDALGRVVDDWPVEEVPGEVLGGVTGPPASA